MKNFLAFLMIAISAIIVSCDSQRSKTVSEEEATYVEDGDTINPQRGLMEGTTGEKYMETSGDSTSIEQ